MAESAWTTKKDKDFDNFQNIMDLQYNRLDTLDMKYYIPTIVGLTNKIATITLSAPIENKEIYYTHDGSTPTGRSLKYNSTIEVKENVTNKEFFKTNYPRGRAIEVFSWFHFDLKKVKNQNSLFRFPFYSLFYIL